MTSYDSWKPVIQISKEYFFFQRSFKTISPVDSPEQLFSLHNVEIIPNKMQFGHYVE